MTTLVERRWTNAQQAAIAARRRTLVAAAAGSGKTSVLTELVAGALAARELAPAEVCAVTFTEKAAQEMRTRIATALHERGELQLASELELARIGTIHGLCAAILRLHGAAVGVDPAAGVLDEAQTSWLERTSIDHLLHDAPDTSDLAWLRGRLGDDRIRTLLSMLVSLDGRMGELTFAEQAAGGLPFDEKTGELLADPREAARAHATILGAWTQLHADLLSRRRDLGMLTYDDLERYAAAAVRIPEVRLDLRSRWTMVLVDEFQDTNARQFELLDGIGAERLFMVGDEWQSIYRFRGADVGVFRARRSDPNSHVLPMRENFRSDAPVLDAVNRLFAHDLSFGAQYEPVIPGTDAQHAAEAPAMELLVVPKGDGDDDRARVLEARRVAERIAELVESGAAEPGDIAVLYARGTGVDDYEEALAAWGLPVLRGASGGYYDQRDVRDALAVLALVRNRHDDHACLSVLAGPCGRLEWHELHALTEQATADEAPLLEAASASSSPGARRVAAMVARLRAVAHRDSLVQLIDELVSARELEIGAAQESDGVRRVANLRRLVDLAASAQGIGVTGLTGFLEFVAAQQRDARVGEAALADEHSGAVRLMTIHASKGLEFPHVFVIEAAARESGRADSVPAPRVDGHDEVHLPALGLDGKMHRGKALAELELDDQSAAREEQRRLWYVALTRARNAVYVSGTWNFEPTKTKARAPRSKPGALGWLADAMELDPFFGGADTTSIVLDGLVRLDTHSASREPRITWQVAAEQTTLAVPLLAAPMTELDAPAATDGDHALRAALRDAVDAARLDEFRQLDGTRVHDAVARLLDGARAAGAAWSQDALLDPERGPWLTDTARERLAPVVASPVFAALVAHGVRTEVPYVAGSGSVVESRVAPGVPVATDMGNVDAGRIDALALLPDGTWWVVDWKTTLDETPDAAWNAHGAQLERYARAAAGAGAPGAIVTLVPLDRPSDAVTWAITPDGARIAISTPSV